MKTSKVATGSLILTIGIPIICAGLQRYGKITTNQFLISSTSAALVFVSVVIWLGFEQFKKSVPRLLLSKPFPHEWTKDNGVKLITWFIKVENMSESVSVDGVQVHLIQISPDVECLRGRDVLLQPHNKDKGKSEFRLDPDHPQEVDLVTSRDGNHAIDIEHASTHRLFIPSGRYKLTLIASGKDVPSSPPAVFEILKNQDGKLSCTAL